MPHQPNMPALRLQPRNNARVSPRHISRPHHHMPHQHNMPHQHAPLTDPNKINRGRATRLLVVSMGHISTIVCAPAGRFNGGFRSDEGVDGHGTSQNQKRCDVKSDKK
eukprot:3418318-Pyramimonas_sp.AAC.2